MGTIPAEKTTDPRLLRLVAQGTSDLQTIVSAAGEYRFVSAAGAASFGWIPADLSVSRRRHSPTLTTRLSSSTLIAVCSPTTPARPPRSAGSDARTARITGLSHGHGPMTPAAS